ncbi:ComEA family DNA-binding protein [Desulfoplanes sp.]
MLALRSRFIVLVLFVSLLGIGLSTGLCADQINLNTATEAQLTTLPGIGAVIASRVIEFRKAHPFKSVDEIMDVKGIGPKVFAKIKPMITV